MTNLTVFLKITKLYYFYAYTYVRKKAEVVFMRNKEIELCIKDMLLEALCEKKIINELTYQKAKIMISDEKQKEVLGLEKNIGGKEEMS